MHKKHRRNWKPRTFILQRVKNIIWCRGRVHFKSMQETGRWFYAPFCQARPTRSNHPRDAIRGHHQFGNTPQANTSFPLYPQSQQHIIIPPCVDIKGIKFQTSREKPVRQYLSPTKMDTPLNADPPLHDTDTKSRFVRESGSTNKKNQEENVAS